MRLLHTQDLTFREFLDTEIPNYAILSHRWGEDEVTFKEMQKRTAPAGQGLAKIQGVCSLAAERGFAWVWIDTCCIDKKSSAELSEAINSMFRWYQNATECYVYLSDVSWVELFFRSAWFTRGWTLQELLANNIVRFYNQEWIYIGDKASLSTEISATTQIPKEYLEMGSDDLVRWASSAAKMSWVSRRTTSRVEDIAYCLMGLFDVNMPLLYGEGEKAFIRLQLEIIKKSSDESIFAWLLDLPIDIPYTTSLLAASPAAFASSGDIVRRHFFTRPPWMMTNMGLEFHVPSEGYSEEDYMDVELNCSRAPDRFGLDSDCAEPPRVSIQLVWNKFNWQRTCTWKHHWIDGPVSRGVRGPTKKIYILQKGL